MRGGAASPVACRDALERRLDVARPARRRGRRASPRRRVPPDRGRPPMPAPARCRRSRARPANGRKKPTGSLVLSMPAIRISGRGTRSSRSAIASAMTTPAPGLWPPSSQISASARRAARPARPAVSRCSRAGQSTLARPASIAAVGSAEPAAAERRDRRAGVGELVAADQPRARQVEQPVLVLIDQAAVLRRGRSSRDCR